MPVILNYRPSIFLPIHKLETGSRPYLCDFVCDIVSSIFDFWGDDSFLRGWRGGALLIIVCLWEVERDQGNLVDGGVLVEVGVGSWAKQAWFDLAEWSWKKSTAEGGCYY